MPTSEAEKEILFHNPPALKPKPDSADTPPQQPHPPSRKVVRPSVGSVGDAVRHQLPVRTEIPPVRQSQVPAPQPVPLSSSQPVAPAPAGESEAARAEIAAAAERARAATVQQQAIRAQPAPAQVPTPQPQAQPQPAAPAPAPAAQMERPSPPVQQAPAQTQAVPQPPASRAQVVSEPAQPPARASRPRRESGTSFLLHTHGLKKVYDGRTVVNGVEVTVRPSEIVGLLGPNGAGKTTSFYMIVGLVQPNGGSVTFDGKDATHEPMYRRARLGMGYLPQEESIFRKLSVEDNILAVMETQSVPRSERRDRANDLMKRFGIQKLARNEAITLSGGEKRRLTIARSLVTNPKLLMLDEPFSGVDPIAVGEIQEIVRDLREQGLAILITDHNVRETLGIVDRAYLMFEGQVKREGSRDFLINDPLSRKLYLGEQFSM